MSAELGVTLSKSRNTKTAETTPLRTVLRRVEKVHSSLELSVHIDRLNSHRMPLCINVKAIEPVCHGLAALNEELSTVSHSSSSDQIPLKALLPNVRAAHYLIALLLEEQPFKRLSIDTSRAQAILGGIGFIKKALQPLNSSLRALPKQIKLAKEFIDGNFDQPITLDDIAAHVEISATPNLCNPFKKLIGITCMEYVNLKRAELAMLRLATTNHEVSNVMSRAGFTSGAQIYHRFSQVSGRNPREFSKQMNFNLDPLVEQFREEPDLSDTVVFDIMYN